MLYTTYLAGAMEAATLKEMSSWRNQFKEFFSSKNLLIYDPVDQETEKVDCEAKDQHQLLEVLKKEKRNKEFFEVMWKIWFGNIPINTKIVDVFKTIRLNKLTFGNNPEDKNNWGDFEAVLRSDFIVVYLPDSHKTVGTYYEVAIALMFDIPIYLIVPDNDYEQINSCLLFAIHLSNGRFFEDLDNCMNYIKRKYF